ncbi:MAG: hypothetical protein WCK95_15760 [Alphaproteobacteria bacterium]|jgi:hypothetical protein
MALDKDPVDVGVDIKRGFARIVASRERPPLENIGYLVGAILWWLVILAALAIVGVSWLPAAILAGGLCWFWPLLPLGARR